MPEGAFQKHTEQGRFCQRCGAWFGELGREPTVELYIAHMVECLGRDSEVWRVLSPYGSLWLNLGGCYWGGKGRSGYELPHEAEKRRAKGETLQHGYNVPGYMEMRPQDGKHPVYKPLDYVPVPHLVAMALQREGWYWRSSIVWHKEAPMPGSMGTTRWERCRVKVERLREAKPGKVNLDRGDGADKASGGIGKNPYAQYEPCPGCPKCAPNGGLVLRYGAWRPTTAHEYVFLMSKTNRYYCDQDAVRTAVKDSSIERIEYGSHGTELQDGLRAEPHGTERMGERWANPAGANARSVQSWATANLPSIAGRDHFAAFSVELAAWCIRAGTSPRGYCPKCNRPWVRVVERSETNVSNEDEIVKMEARGVPRTTANLYATKDRGSITTLGWKATCECGLEPRPGIVLDPFGGSGTVGLAAKALWPASRDYILVEISEEYCEMARHRIRKGFTPGRKKQQIPEAQMRLGL